MADFSAPFQMPTFSDEEHLKRKAEYVEENGYSISFPQLGDIIHLGQNKPMTEEEKILWYDKRRDEIPPARLEQLYKQKERARDKYHKMLSSPIPNWLQSYTSILTAWDNVQDVVISLAAVGRIALMFLPRAIGAWLGWPVGLLWAIASIMSTIAAPTMCALNPMHCKRKMKKEMQRRNKMLRAKGRLPERGTKAWMAMESEKLKRGFKGYAKSGGFLPSFSEGIQALQVTKDIWGVGLSIGPIFGLAYDLISGGVRWISGQDVSFKNAPSDIEIYRRAEDAKHTYARWKRPSGKMTKSEYIAWKKGRGEVRREAAATKQDDMIMRAMKLSQTTYGRFHGTNWQEEAAVYAGTEIAATGVAQILEHWNPLENVVGLEHLQIEAYNEPNPLIEEMLLEEGVDPDAGIAWPSNGKRWATYEEIQTSLAPIAAENYEYMTETCEVDNLRVIMESSAAEFGLNCMALLEGPEFLEIEYHAALDIAETLLSSSYSFPLEVTEPQITQFALWTQAHQDNETRPTLKEVLAYAKNTLGFEFTTVPGDRSEL